VLGNKVVITKGVEGSSVPVKSNLIKKEKLMDMLELIKSRRSIRNFEKKIPEKRLIMECLEAATWAPSATNQQPWEFIVLTGAELERVNTINQENFAERMQQGLGDDFVSSFLSGYNDTGGFILSCFFGFFNNSFYCGVYSFWKFFSGLFKVTCFYHALDRKRS